VFKYSRPSIPLFTINCQFVLQWDIYSGLWAGA